jgi:hypothetical protein
LYKDRIAQLICEKIASPGGDVMEIFCLQFSECGFELEISVGFMWFCQKK